MTVPPDDRYPQVDTSQTEHEREVAEREERDSSAGRPSAEEAVNESSGRTADDDLAADQRPGDESTR